ncbi:MAG TPA: biliverdin-producing heme oxygenase [Bryobacteraceae bacterium]|nr:biliverdin-producing heme oxygenase [Bryobacteraceae bacterium]
MNILLRLKHDTADLHERVERHIPIFSPQFDLSAYITLIERFYGYWAPLEEQLLKVDGLCDPPLVLPERLKTHLLSADLQRFGVNPHDLPTCSALPDVSTFPRACGCLYVLEGSTLGSQVIARQLRQALDLDRENGASYFNAYGPETGARWRTFREFVEARTSPEFIAPTVAAARETFASLDCWLTAIS